MSLPLTDIASGGKSWAHEMGDKIGGTVRMVERRQQRNFSTGEPEFWGDGKPKMLTYIELDTDLRESDDDDGVRALYCKGGNFEAQTGSGVALEKAIVEAVKAAGASSIDEGAKLQVACTGLAKPTTRGYQPAKLYTAKYEAPKASVAVSDLFSDDD